MRLVEPNLRARAAAVATLICLSSWIGPTACGLGAARFERVPPSPEALQLEPAMFQRLNADRAAQGLPGLSYDEALADVARAHSADMVAHAFFEHHSPNTGTLENRLNLAGYVYATGRENLALDVDVDTAEDHLLESPGHRANILAEDITHVGIGIVRGSGPWGDGVLYVTQVFARPVAWIEPTDMAARIGALADRQRADRALAQLVHNDVLQRLAEEAVAMLDDPPSEKTLRVAGKHVAAGLAAAGLRGKAIDISAQLVLEPESFALPVTLDTPGPLSVGIAARVGHDDKQRKAVVVLLLLVIPS